MSKIINAICGILFVFIILNNTLVYGESEKQYNANKQDHLKAQNIKYKNFQPDSDVMLQGVYGNYTVFFKVNTNWDIQEENYLELIYSYSDIWDKLNSTITIFINDTPIKSTEFDVENKDSAKLKCAIPKNLLKDGFNEVRIVTYHRISENGCEDDINPANWILLKKDSFIHIAYKDLKDNLMLDNFPYPYISEEQSEQMLQSTMVVSEDAGNATLKAAMILSANVGQKYPFHSVQPEIEFFSEQIANKEQHLIYVAMENELNTKIRSLLSQEEINGLKKEALIKEIRSPFSEEKNMLIIVSGNEENLIYAALSLTEERLIKQMKSNKQWISKEGYFSSEQKMQDEKISFEELGFSDTLMKGDSYQVTHYGIAIPKNWEMKDGSKVVLQVRYSDILNFDHSTVTLDINGVPIGSHKLTPEKATGDQVEIRIPEELRDMKNFTLGVTFRLRYQRFNCKYPELDNDIWAFISKESYFDIPHKIKNEYYFDDYSAPFVEEGLFNDLLIVIPEKMKQEELKTAASIMSYLGRGVGSIQNFHIVRANKLKQDYYDNNMIIIGIPKNSPLIQTLNDHLYIKFNELYDQFLSNEKIMLLDNYRYHLASIQLIPSPYNQQKQILIVTATMKEGLEWGSTYLSDIDFASQLKGDAAVIDKEGNIQYAYFKAKKEIQPKIDAKEDQNDNNEGSALERKKIKQFIIILGGVIIMVLITIGLLLRQKRKKE